MTDADQKRENEVLKRMLKTPPKPHKEKGPADERNDKKPPSHRRSR